jgi:vancomycin resistance protein VanJ
MVAVIREANADIVALQEMSPAAAERFDSALADLYPYRALHPADSPYHGRGILSRYPIADDYSWPVEYPIPVRLERAKIDLDGTTITVYNMHAPPSQPIFGQGIDLEPRREQIAALMDQVAGDSGAVLVMGDFNTSDMEDNYARITAQLADSFHEVGWGLGFTNPDWSWENSREGLAFIPPYQRVDYVFHNTFFQPVEARVWPTSGGSDHRPVYAVLSFSR